MSAVANGLEAGFEILWYQIDSVLGRGGFGITYLARDNNLGQLVAIKEYLPHDFAARSGDSTVQPVSVEQTDVFSWGLERFMSEAQTLAKFKHPNIVRVLSVFKHNNTGYMVMEYEQGEDLSDTYKREKKLSQGELESIYFPIIDGLALVHKEGFIHRDIKPANIFIRSDGSPVLIDFGAARQAVGSKTKTLTSMLSIGYAPFEQYNDEPGKQGPWTDIYALGASLFQGITGEKPMESTIRGMALLHDEPDPCEPLSQSNVEGYTHAFLRAIDQALMLQIHDRPQTLEDFLGMLKGEIALPVLPDKSEEVTESTVVRVRDPQRNSSRCTLYNSNKNKRGRKEIERTISQDKKISGKWWIWGGITSAVILLALLAIILVSGGAKKEIIVAIAGLKDRAALARSIRANYFSPASYQEAESYSSRSKADYDQKKYKSSLELIQMSVGAYTKSIGDSAPEYLKYLNWKMGKAFRGFKVKAKELSYDEMQTQVSKAYQAKKAKRLLELNGVLNDLLNSASREFTVGSSENEIEEALDTCNRDLQNCERAWYLSEKHKQTILAPFEIDESAVTVERFRHFVEAGDYISSAEQTGSVYVYDGLNSKKNEGLSWRDSHFQLAKTLDGYPVVFVSRNDAERYCQQQSKRLPSAPEWEYHFAKFKYPWGSDDLERPEYPVDASQLSAGVVSFSNVWEWTSTMHDEKYAVLKGGSYFERTLANRRSHAHRFELPNVASNDTGFRCARDLEAWPNSDEESLWSIYQQRLTK